MENHLGGGEYVLCEYPTFRRIVAGFYLQANSEETC